MILLTGATGTVGAALLRRLTAAGTPVRCLVRDPKRLGPERVRVQIALGDLADPASFRNALRGVDTVVHLAGSIRDQPRGSIEELNAMATLRLVRGAEKAGAKRFVFTSALNASLQSPTRFFRAKALARRAVESASLETTVFCPSVVYTPGDPWLTLLDRLSHLPVLPMAGDGAARFQPIWAEDVADCIMAALDLPLGSADRSRPSGTDDVEPNGAPHRAFELAGPEVLSYDEIAELALRSSGRRRPLLHIPMPAVRAGLRGLERVVGPSIFATAEEVDLMEEPMTSSRGTADAESLGVNPLRMSAVLGAAPA
ncbi:MAG TPA: NAD(P)H-binding protein [Thermoleophilaceae bacterium]|nr:NAD(P)H-binding protein [Thermoleophilaceae bacterium]